MLIKFIIIFFFVTHKLTKFIQEKKKKAGFEPDVNRTRNLLIWSQTRYHCATDPPSKSVVKSNIDITNVAPTPRLFLKYYVDDKYTSLIKYHYTTHCPIYFYTHMTLKSTIS